jgi:hypothetical protein
MKDPPPLRPDEIPSRDELTRLALALLCEMAQHDPGLAEMLNREGLDARRVKALALSYRQSRGSRTQGPFEREGEASVAAGDQLGAAGPQESGRATLAPRSAANVRGR